MCIAKFALIFIFASIFLTHSLSTSVHGVRLCLAQKNNKRNISFFLFKWNETLILALLLNLFLFVFVLAFVSARSRGIREQLNAEHDIKS